MIRLMFLIILCIFNFVSMPCSTFGEVSSRIELQDTDELDKKVTIDFSGAMLRDVLKTFTHQTGLNFVVDSNVNNSVISLFLNEVTVKEALNSIAVSNNLAYYKIVGTSVIRIKRKMRAEEDPKITKVYKLKYIHVASMELIDLSEEDIVGVHETFKTGTVDGTGSSAEGEEEMSSTEDEEEITYPGLITALTAVISSDGSLTFDDRTNTIIITDYPDRFERIEDIIEALDRKVNQIMIKAEIIEISDSLNRILGIEYGGSDGTLAGITATAATAPHAYPWSNWNEKLNSTEIRQMRSQLISDTSFDSDYYNLGTLSADTFRMVLKAIENSGKSKYLSRPRLLTMDGTPALIDIMSDTAIEPQTESDQDANTTVSSYERRDTGILLRITPNICGLDEYVSMFVEPVVSRASVSAYYPDSTLDIYRRRVRTKVRVRNGDTVSIGGLYQKSSLDSARKIPFLGDIPIIGSIFRQKTKQGASTELLIFITPYIINDDNVDTLHKRPQDDWTIKKTDEKKKEIQKKRLTKTNHKIRKEIQSKKEEIMIGQKTLAQKISEYEKVVVANPKDVVALSNLGVAYAKAGKYDPAIKQFKKAIVLDPNSGAAYNNLGNLYRIKKEYGAAVECLKRAVELVPGHPYAYTTMGLCYEMNDKFEDARRAYKNAVKFAPNAEWTSTAKNRLSALEGRPSA